jgi:hypothetical protein
MNPLAPRFRSHTGRRLCTFVRTTSTAIALALGFLWGVLLLAELAHADPLPERLSTTGLYASGSTGRVADGVHAFAPQYPLWSDGARKRRWIWLPPGSAIDASDPDAWQFPIGTKFWKQFSYERAIETRLIERTADGAWRFATYVWDADGRDAELAPEAGVALEIVDAPGGRYAVPSQNDCRACHEGAAVPVLGFSALQLSSDRDPHAPHAEHVEPGMLDLKALVTAGLLVGLPSALQAAPPRVEADDVDARAALGYLHANCGHCHNDAGALDGLQMVLAQRVAPGSNSVETTLDSLLGRTSRFRPHGTSDAQRIAPDGNHMLTLRMRTRNPFARMPPLGVSKIDEAAVELVERWISKELRKHTGDEP